MKGTKRGIGEGLQQDMAGAPSGHHLRQSQMLQVNKTVLEI